MFCRIQSLVPTLSVELLVDPSTIQCDWVKYNLCPEFDNIRKKTELPFWVFTAISSVVQSKCFLPYINKGLLLLYYKFVRFLDYFMLWF